MQWKKKKEIRRCAGCIISDEKLKKKMAQKKKKPVVSVPSTIDKMLASQKPDPTPDPPKIIEQSPDPMPPEDDIQIEGKLQPEDIPGSYVAYNSEDNPKDNPEDPQQNIYSEEQEIKVDEGDDHMEVVGEGFDSETDLQNEIEDIEMPYGDDDDMSDGDWGSDLELDSKGDIEQGVTPKDSIPDSTHFRADIDVNEMNLTTRFCASNNIKGLRVQMKIGIRIASLGMNREQQLAWGLGDNTLVVVEVDFGSHYITATNAPKIEVGAGTSVSGDTTMKPFLMAWTLTNRLKKFFSKWPFDIATAFKIPDGFNEITSLKEKFPHIRYGVIKTALEKTKTEHQATELLMDENQLKLIQKEVRKSRKVTKPKSSIFRSTKESLSKAFVTFLERQHSDESDSSASNSPMTLQTQEEKNAFSEKVLDLASQASVPPETAALAIELEGTFEGAIELLSDEKSKRHLLDSSNSISESSSKSSDLEWEYVIEQHNLLAKIAIFSTGVLSDANKYCMLCSKSLEYVGSKPAVCNEKTCMYAYEEFGLGFDLNLEVLQNKQLVDLLISFLAASIDQARVEICFPESVRGSGKNIDKSFMIDGKQNPELLREVVRICPSLEQMQPLARLKTLVKHLNSLHPLLYPLLRWLITSNRAHIRMLLPEERIKGIGTDHQFVFVSCPPEREAQFGALVKRAEKSKGVGKGKIQTWHGSRMGNWHSILRMGLKNFSNTKYMANAAAYGAGVYMAKDSQTSVGYCRAGANDGWQNSMFGKGFYCMALCQVVNHPDLKPPSPFYVVPQESWIVTRFFFIHDKTSSHSNVSAESVKLPDIGAVHVQ